MTYRVFLLLSILLPLQVTAQQTGDLYSRAFSPREYGSANTIWEMTQTTDGTLYFGTSRGITSFNGSNWKHYSVANETTIRSMDTRSRDTIYVGAKKEFGFFHADSSGALTYQSLSETLTEEQQDFNDVWNTYVTKHGVFYLTFKGIFRYYKGEVLEYDSIPLRPHLGFTVNDELYIIQRRAGLKKFDGNRFVDVPGGSVFANSKVYGLTTFSDHELLAFTFDGLIKINPTTGDTAHLRPELGQELIQRRLYHAIRLDNNNIAVATRTGGIYMLSPSLELIQTITVDNGLISNDVKYLYQDHQKQLWAGTANGITMVEAELPLAFFNKNHGLQGASRDIAVFGGRLYVSTSTGVFEYQPEASLHDEQFLQAGDKTIQSWSLLEFGEHLVVGTGSGIYTLAGNKTTDIARNYVSIFAMSRSVADTNVAYCATKGGIATITKSHEDLGKSNLQFKPAYKGLTNEIHNVLDDELGNLYGTTGYNYVVKAKIIAGTDSLHWDSIKFSTLFSNESLFRLEGSIYLCGRDSILRVENGQLIDVTADFNARFRSSPERYIGYVRSLNNGDYLVHYHRYDSPEDGFGYYIIPKGFTAKERIEEGPLYRIKEKLLHPDHVCEDTQGNIWFGASSGVVAYHRSSWSPTELSYNSLITEVYLGDSSSISSSNFIQATTAPVIPHAENTVKFHYGANWHANREELVYRYMLEPYETEWSEWTKLTHKEYTNLSGGDYTFKVQAKNVYRVISEEAEYRFTVLPPWYLTGWAITIFGILILFITWLVSKITTYRLYKAKRKLELMVQERTREIAEEKRIVEERNEEITQQKVFIEEVNDQLAERNQDIIDSLNYAKHIQSAILPDDEKLERNVSDHFIFYRPRDIVSGDFYWYEQVNDVLILAAADCTGHGVPGAFMSMICATLLDKVVRDHDITAPEKALTIIDLEVRKALGQDSESQEITANDGMDVGLIVIHREKMMAQYSGAFRPLILIRDNEVHQFKGSRGSIGGQEQANKHFEGHEIPLQPGDMLYLFSDGYPDQFGGQKNKKFKLRRFVELLQKIHQRPAAEQYEALDQVFKEWKSNEEQTDDVLVIGLRI